MRSSTSLPKNMQILLLSRPKALSRVNAAIAELCGPVESVLSTLARKAYGDSGILSRVAHSPNYKPPARPLGLLRQCLLHCQHVGLWSQISHVCR